MVSSGFDVADRKIVEELNAGGLVITGDIPLASEVIDIGGYVLNPRGEMYSSMAVYTIEFSISL